MWEPKWLTWCLIQFLEQDCFLFLLLPFWKLPRKTHSEVLSVLPFPSLRYPAPSSMLLSGTCPLLLSMGAKWPGRTHRTSTEEETKHRHILHVCMAHRESLPSHLCGLISLFLSSFLCFSLYTLCSCLKMLNLW